MSTVEAKREVDRMSLSEILAVEQKIAKIRQARRDQLAEDMSLLAKHGIDLNGQRRVSKAKPNGKVGRPKKAAFVNPENRKETWAGRGRRPAWLTAKLDDGEKLDSFRA